MQYECEDIIGNAALFSMVGAGLGESEVYRIALASRRLGEDTQHGVAGLRFFGKFFGRAADYYVFEATLREPAPSTGDAAGTVKGEGGRERETERERESQPPFK